MRGPQGPIRFAALGSAFLLAGAALAAACPQCAGAAGAGPAKIASLGAMIALPFAVVAMVVPFIRRGPAAPRN